MGFSHSDSTRALNETDRGNAIDVEAAADLLMREREMRRRGNLRRTSGVSERWCRLQHSTQAREMGMRMSMMAGGGGRENGSWVRSVYGETGGQWGGKGMCERWC
jgi:hypothetical protein